jgi:peptidoglycan/xylan/chitin deacetylase (PgdA/CDA1 family)
MIRKFHPKQIGRQMLSLVSYYSGFCFLRNCLKMGSGARILCYHGISETPKNQFAVSAENFTAQIHFLTDHFRIVSIDHLVALLQNIHSIPPNTIALSIDDGFQDFYSNGFPILRQFAVPATVFIPTGCIDGDSKSLTHRKLPQNEFLTWDQIREMSLFGIDFGSHSVSHNSLTQLPHREIQYELEYSKERLESEIGKKINGFAYPYGTFRDIDPKIGELIARTGFSWAVTSISGVNKPGSNRFALRRTMIEDKDGLQGFKRAVSGSLDGWIVFQKMGYYLKKGNHIY